MENIVWKNQKETLDLIMTRSLCSGILASIVIVNLDVNSGKWIHNFIYLADESLESPEGIIKFIWTLELPVKKVHCYYNCVRIYYVFWLWVKITQNYDGNCS